MASNLEHTLAAARANLRAGRSPDHGIAEPDWLALKDRHSHFVDRRDAQGCLCDSHVVIVSPHTPRPCLHLMASTLSDASGTWGSFWDQFGGGFSCVNSVLAGRMTSHLDTNYVPTAPEPQDVRAFFIHEGGTAWPMFPLSAGDAGQYTDWQCIQGLDRHVLRARRNGLACQLEVTVHPRLPLETWTVTIAGLGESARRFSWFLRARVNVDSFPSYYFVPRVVCEGILEDGCLVFLNHDQNNRHPRQAFFMAEPGFDGFDMMGEVFDGIGGRSPIPAAVAEGRCRNSLGFQPYAGLVAAAQFDAELAPGETRRWVCVYGLCPYESSARRDYLHRVRSEVLRQPDRCDNQVRNTWETRIAAEMARTPSADLDRYFNVWSKYQARNQSRFCRALDKIGYRDVLQDLIGICDGDLPFVRERLLHTLRFQSADGRAVRQYEACPGAGHDMRMYMDSSSWIPDTLACYIEESGDFDILDETIPFFDMDSQRPDESQTGTVYDHAIRAVRSLADNTGYHGLCRIGYGDWNDALSGIGGEQGVSVWLSCAAVHAARRLGGLAAYLGRTDDAQEMRRIAETMIARINEHAWDGRWYIYAINGQGQPIGSKDSAEGRIHLNVNTWALFTGVAAAAGRENHVWQALEQLATPLGHMLLTPPYTARSRAGVGRIADQKPGLFENGSIYLHGEAFYLYALIAAGRGDECYRHLLRTLPSEMIQDIATGPRHQQSNFTVGPDHPNWGTQLFSNFTGSVSWYRRVIRCMLGVRPTFDALAIAPCPPSDWQDYEVHKRWRGRMIRVRVRRGGPPGCRILMGGRSYDENVPFSHLSPDRVNEIDITLG